MGEDLEADGRMAVRTPMQWNDGPNGGFSDAPARRLRSRVVPGGYGPEHINVADQRRDPGSLWNFMRELIQSYRSCPELGWGEFHVLEQPHEAVLAHACERDGKVVIAVHNLSSEPVTVELKVADEKVRLEDVLGEGVRKTDDKGVVEVALEGYGFRWARLHPMSTRVR